MKAAHYLKSQVCFLSVCNYEVVAAIGEDVQSLKPLLTVLDTGTGPNLIREDLLTPEMLAPCDTKRPMMNRE